MKNVDDIEVGVWYLIKTHCLFKLKEPWTESHPGVMAEFIFETEWVKKGWKQRFVTEGQLSRISRATEKEIAQWKLRILMNKL